jgi:predicted O-methyltransferase YrrM
MDELNETARAFMESRVLLSAIELDVFSAVSDPATATQVAARLGTDPRATETLLNALTAMGLLLKAGGVFSNGPQAARYLAQGSPDDARAALLHTVNLWDRWSTLTACVRAGTAVSHQEMARRGDGWTVPFIAAMHRNALARAPLVVRAIDAAGVRRMIDVGGGSGAYAIAFAGAAPELRAEIFDLAPVVKIAQQHIDAAGLGDRVTTRVGDLRVDELGAGHDLVLLSAICHMLSPDENRDLLRRAWRALAPGGRIVIQDSIMSDDKTTPRGGALFAINMLVGTPAGGVYSEAEYCAWLREAGCSGAGAVPIPGPTSLVVGRH